MFFPSLGLIATTDVISVGIHESIQDALKKMHDSNHRSVVVVNGSLHYIISSKDMIRLRVQGTDFSNPLSQIELRLLPMLDKESNVIHALNLTNDLHEHICVCNENGSLYGLVTNSDIVASVDPQVIMESLQIGTIFDKKYGFKSLHSSVTMDEVLPYMQEAPTDCVLIHDENRPLGIITSKDILKFIDGAQPYTIKAGAVMSSPIDTLPLTASIADALAFIKQRHYKRIIVVDEAGTIAGIVTQQDLISRTYLKWSQLVNEHFHQFEELTQILQQRNRHLTVLATQDPLTGIHNRHMFAELFEKDVAALKRYHTHLSLVMIDLDHFKAVNDTYGHNIGDLVLKEFANLVLSTIREADLFARWGGEEFVLLLSNTMCDEAFLAAEKIRQKIESAIFEEIGHITCSLGMTEVRSEDSLESAIERADRALYEAKHGGRNQSRRCSAESLSYNERTEV